MDQSIADHVTFCSLDEETISPYVKELKVILSDLIAKKEADHIEYIGGSEGRPIYKDKDLAVQLSILEKGESFPEHYHPIEKEWLILVKGEATVWIDGEVKKLKERDSIVLEPKTNHRGIANANTTMVCVSIPADRGYPDVGD
jgi:quercetin dioxygenase-like cupin family protein